MAPASSSRAARDPLLFARFDLPAVWGCRKPLDFCREARDTDNAPVASEPDATATPTEGVKDSDGTRSPTRATAMVQQAPVAGEVAQEAPRKQWNLRERTPWQDYSNRADDLRARQARKLGSADAGGNRRLSLSVKLTRQEIDADFAKITGSKAPRRPMKRSKTVQRKIERKKLYEQQIEQLGNFQLRIHDQMIMLEAPKATTETVDANIDDVDKTMDEINEQTENMKQIQDALSTPLGASADFDEVIHAELEELEGAELESQLLEPVAALPVHPVHVPGNKQPARPAPQKATAEDDELAALQAEMAL
uniref:Uncharacterized protein n=1 Tax=Zea mays TaxID=4577 RepID=A0A804R7N6_MAIZE